MEVMTTAAIRRAKLQSNHRHQRTNTQLFTGRMLFLSPNQQCVRALSSNSIHMKQKRTITRAVNGTGNKYLYGHVLLLQHQATDWEEVVHHCQPGCHWTNPETRWADMWSTASVRSRQSTWCTDCTSHRCVSNCSTDTPTHRHTHIDIHTHTDTHTQTVSFV